MAISGHHSKASLRNYIGHPSSEKIRTRSDILSDVLWTLREAAKYGSNPEKNWILKPKLLEIKKKKRFFVLLWINIYLFLHCISFLKIAFNISIVTVLKLQLIPLSFLLARLQIIFKFALKFVRLVTNFQTAPT